jgi:hypothetical protein
VQRGVVPHKPGLDRRQRHVVVDLLRGRGVRIAPERAWRRRPAVQHHGGHVARVRRRRQYWYRRLLDGSSRQRRAGRRRRIDGLLVDGEGLAQGAPGEVDVRLQPELPLALAGRLIAPVLLVLPLRGTSTTKLLLEVRVPVVLDVVVSALRQVRRDGGPAVPQQRLEVDDEAVLLLGEPAAADARAEVVGPPQPAALAAPRKPRRDGDGAPVAGTVLLHVRHQHQVLLRRPGTLLHAVDLVAARRTAHRERERAVVLRLPTVV